MSGNNVIQGIKLIQHNASNVNELDDPTYPWKLEAYFRPPEFMNVAFLFLHGGTETIVVRGMTEGKLKEFATFNNLYNHPRLISLNIYQP